MKLRHRRVLAPEGLRTFSAGLNPRATATRGWGEAAAMIERHEGLRLRAEADYTDPDPALRRMIDDLPLASGDAVLDLGCGAGQFSAWLAERVGIGGTVEAVDPNEGVLDVAQQLLA